jgi:hypothetical protein
MCVIASIPAGKVIDDKTFKQMWDRNPDGGGIAYMTDADKIEVFKSMDMEELLGQYKVIAKKHGNHDMLIHMRIATHGSVCMDNNHPFWIDPQTVFAHNGIMPQAFHPPAKSDLSDTRYFNQVYLQYVKPVAFDDDGFREQLGDVIGYNKLVILSTNKKLRKESYIINERLGSWEDGIWYSNTHHLPVKKTVGQSFVFNNNKPKTKPTKVNQLVMPTNASEDSYLINPELYADPDFQELIADVLEVSGYQELEDVLIDYELEVNPVTGVLHCLACGTIVDSNLDRACTSECWAIDVVNERYDNVLDSYDQMVLEDACIVQADKKLGKGSK